MSTYPALTVACLIVSVALSNAQMLHGIPPFMRQTSRENLQVVSRGIEQFSLELLATTASEAGSSINLVLSPFSVWAMLVLTAEGSAGNTFTELQRVLRLPPDMSTVRNGYHGIGRALLVNATTIELETVNAIFTDINRPVDPDYENVVEHTYFANMAAVNFINTQSATNSINDYIKNATRNKIDTIVVQDDLRDAQLLLINAVFFKGQWTTPFNTTETKIEPFYDESGREIGTVNMMFQSNSFPYIMMQKLNAHVLQIPYGKENRLSMYVILPMAGVSLLSVLQNVRNTPLNEIYDALDDAMEQFYDEPVDVHLPRFGVTSDLTLNVILEKMGLLDIFDPKSANLSKISNHAIFLSRVIHKAEIEVTEEGTVASAVTAGSFSNKSSPPRFYANRPFMYLIVEKTTNIMVFAGTCSNPASFKI